MGATVYAADFTTWFSGQEDQPVPFRADIDATTGEYRLALPDPSRGSVYYRYAPEGRGFADFRLDVEARRIAGVDTSAYGIVFRAQAQGPTDRTNARYTFIVYANGSFALTMARADGTVAVVAPRTPSPVIKRGDDTNHLTILCWGDRISLAINGYVVGEYEVTLSGAGAIGLYVSSPENTPSPPGMEAGFKDLRVSTVAAP